MARDYVYREYTEGISPKAALAILVALGASLVLLEVGLRLKPSHLPRTSANSMHGTRTMMLQALEDPRPKLVAVGDSALQGGGVVQNKDILMGMAAEDLGAATGVYNFGLPGGNNKTNVQILQAMERTGVKNIDQVVIQALPQKFLATEPIQTKGPDWGFVTAKELERFLPDGHIKAPWVTENQIDLPHWVESRLQFDLGRASYLYRSRDLARNTISGGYPSYWVFGLVMPPSLRNRVLGQRADGNNRLAAQPQDEPYDRKMGKPSDVRQHLVPEGEFDALLDAIRVAKKISKKPPIVMIQPFHYEYNQISEAERQSTLSALADLKEVVSAACSKEGARLLWIESSEVQDPALWTRTLAHFQPPLHRKIWEQLKAMLAE